MNIVEGGRLELAVRGYAGGGGLVGGLPTLVGPGPSVGTLNMSGGELIVSGADPVIFLGSDLDNVGVLNLSGGRIESGNLWVARAGHGTVNQTGGTMISRNLILDEACTACGAVDIGDTSGTYNMSGGELTVVGRADIGRLGRPSSAVFNLSGGVFTTSVLVFPTNNESDQFNMSKVGVLRINGGEDSIIDDSGYIDAQTAIEFGRITGLNLQVGYEEGEDGDGNPIDIMVVRNPGDPNASGTADASDIDALSAVVSAGSNDLSFDLTDDDQVTQSDREEWVTNVAMTFFGDTDLNGSVEFGDFITLSNNFGREGGWDQGDNDGNRMIEFGDFIALSNNFGQSASSSVSTVPEPSSFVMVALAVLGLMRYRLC